MIPSALETKLLRLFNEGRILKYIKKLDGLHVRVWVGSKEIPFFAPEIMVALDTLLEMEVIYQSYKTENDGTETGTFRLRSGKEVQNLIQRYLS